MPVKDTLRGRSPRDKRDERAALGFVRQPAVRWLSPGLLAKSGVEVVVSGTFGKFADKRELQTEEQGPFDYSGDGELWVDYLSDTGDGWEATYTMAWLLAQPSLAVDGRELARGRLLLLGGDQVYPSATAEAYEDRFIGPFASALPKSNAADKPHMYALPGNHDWYDGLVSFLRVFCGGDVEPRPGDEERDTLRPGQIGDWLTHQRRSYFALRLPCGWWIWAIDIQLDTYLDSAQLRYFAAQPVARGEKIVLMTAKPAWVKSYPRLVEPASWRYLSFFEERFVHARGARLALTITGDLHHYARYEPVDEPDEPTRITAGGGGAYLSGTHTLREELELRSLDAEPEESVAYRREQIYPGAARSRRLSIGILRLALLNPGFALLVGGLYAALGVGALAALGSGDDTLEAATQHGVDGFVTGAAGGLTLLVVGLLFAALFGGTDLVTQPFAGKASAAATRAARLAVALAHTAAHVAIAGGVLWLVIELVGGGPWAIVPVALAALVAAGAAFGATLFGAVLLAIHAIRGEKAQEAANQVFTGQSIADHKSFVRMHFAADGSLTLYPLGVDEIGRDWTHTPHRAPDPLFSPRAGAPRTHAIDGPLRFDTTGRRAQP